MIQIILPTGELLHDYKYLEEMFAFYQSEGQETSGLKALVRDMVLLADQDGLIVQKDNGRVRNAFKHALRTHPLVEKVMRDYANSAEARFLFRIDDGKDQSSNVESNVEILYERVLDMMSAIFMRTVYEVSKQEWEWVGDDLVTTVQIIDKGVL